MQAEIEPVESELVVFEAPSVVLGNLVTWLSKTLTPLSRGYPTCSASRHWHCPMHEIAYAAR